MDSLRKSVGEAGVASKDEIPQIDVEFEEATEGEESSGRRGSRRSGLSSRPWLLKRLELIAKDIVDHFEARLEAMEGKAMACA